VAEKCKWEMKVVDQMGSKAEERNAAERICCWGLRGIGAEPGLVMGCSWPGFGLQGQCVRSTHLNPACDSGCTSKCEVKLLSTSRISPQCSEVLSSCHSSAGEQKTLTSSYSLFALSFQQAQAEEGLLEDTVHLSAVAAYKGKERKS